MDYDLTFGVEKTGKQKEVGDFIVKLRGFSFFCTSF